MNNSLLKETRASKVAREEKREGGTQDWLLLAPASFFHLAQTFIECLLSAKLLNCAMEGAGSTKT